MPRQLPKLPSDWEWVNEDEPPPTPDPLSRTQSQRQIGSVLRQIEGPPLPSPPLPSFMETVVKPVAKAAIPTDPVSIGLFVASSLMTGSPIAGRVMGKVGSEMVPIAEDIMSTGLRRIGTMAGVGGLLGGPSGAFQGLVTQGLAEPLKKITQWSRMNKQASDLAKEDPIKLGQIVSQIIPNIGEIKTANDFHRAFKLAGAQTAISEAYRKETEGVAEKLGDTLLPSQAMTDLRGPAKSVTLMRDFGGVPASSVLAGPGRAGKYSFEDIANTVRRLRSVGWTEEERARGLAATDAREMSVKMADELAQELRKTDPALAEKWQNANSMYARGLKIMNFFDDPKMLKPNGDLNVPALQRKLKGMGYPTRDSYEVIADALALQDTLFRGDPRMIEDIPGEPGRLLSHFRLHFGILPTFYPKPPKVGEYAGRQAYGLTDFSSSQLMQLLRRGMSAEAKSPANTLKAEEE